MDNKELYVVFVEHKYGCELVYVDFGKNPYIGPLEGAKYLIEEMNKREFSNAHYSIHKLVKVEV